MSPLDVDMDMSSESFTILRIKRKRNDEPLDALLVEATKRRKVPDQSIFQFAETVEEAVWQDEVKTIEMKTRISQLARKIIPLRKAVATKTEAPEAQPRAATPSSDPTRRYTIITNNVKASSKRMSPVRKEKAKPSLFTPLPPLHPPVVRSARELREEKERVFIARFKVYDAVPLSSKQKTTNELSVDDDPRMANFLPMLEEYLRINDVDLHPKEEVIVTDKASDNDYVWDVFIHRTMSLEDWNNVALLGSITGLPHDDDYPSDESEVEDEADEDSNDENWYANDYPDEEESESEGILSDDGNSYGWR